MVGRLNLGEVVSYGVRHRRNGTKGAGAPSVRSPLVDDVQRMRLVDDNRG